ncbi:ABC transporter substrate binding protein [Desulfitobacterium dehalogenans]
MRMTIINNNLMKKFIIILIVFFCLFSGPKPSVQAQTNQRVLFISSYSESFETVPEQIAGIHEALDPQNILLDIEYMDTKRFDTQENVHNFFTSLQYKLDHTEPYDAIIVGDDRALDFAMTYQKELFAELPILFLGINDINRAEEAARSSYITGIVESVPIKENIELALKFNSNVNRVLGLVESSITGMGEKDQFYGAVGFYPSLRFEDVNISEHTQEEMAGILQEIKDDTIVLFIGSMYRDKAGVDLSIDEAAAFISANTHVPVYRPTIGGVGQGFLGGMQISYREMGKRAGEMAVQVLSGTPVQDIPMMNKSPYHAIFDYQVVQQFDLPENLLPGDAFLLNKEVSYFEQNMKLLMGVFAALFIMMIISTLMGIDSLKHRTMQRKLRESNEELSATYEELAATEEELRHQYKLIEENVQRIELFNQKYEHAIYSTNSVVWELNLSNRNIYFSQNFQNWLSHPFPWMEPFDVLMKKYLDEKTAQLINDEIAAYLDGKKSEIMVEFPVKPSSNQPRWIKAHGKSIQGSGEEEVILYGILTDVTEGKRQQEHIDHLAHYDYLTNLPNRMSFMKTLQEEVEKGQPLYIILMDIDNFKEINDTLGHVWGDKVLRSVAQKLSDNACPNMFISRFGGDEFLVLITNRDGCSMEECIKHIRTLFEQPIPVDRNEYTIKFSMGITRYPEDSTNIDQLIMNADTALYQVKRNGKNHHLLYNKEMQQELRNKAVTEGIIQKAVQEDGFYLVYQPQVNVKTGEIESFEALVRLKHHAIPPDVFIGIAEESDLICQIGRAVTKEAIRQAANWRDKGHPRKPISINFSSKQIRDKDYLQFLINTLEEYELDPQYLEIEITESILLEETELTLELLERIKELGIKIALDDFGTGFSSLNYLTYIPVNKVKLDKSLCDKFLSPDNIKVIESIISLAHSLNLVITAEGIEEQWQYEQLKASGCNTIQGYLFSKPLIAEEAEKIYEKNFLHLI